MKAVLLFVCLIAVCLAHRHEKCSQQHVVENLWKERSDLKLQHESLNKIAAEYVDKYLNSTLHRRDNPVIRIPVVWHVLYSAPGHPTEVPRSAIDQEMVWLNDWYSTQNVNYGNAAGNYFEDVIAVDDDLKIRFEYAVIDPMGNPFDGVEYFQTSIATSCSESNTFFSDNGGVDIWNPLQYFNIYTCAIDSGALGYAYLPSSTTHPQDGMVHNYAELGNAFFSGSTISHEAGHWLGLYHTFEGCGSPGDFVADTPSTDEPAFDWANALGDCPSRSATPAESFIKCTDQVVMVENNMDYNAEPCLSYFSKGQAARMRFYLTDNSSSRKGLQTSPALAPACPTYDCDNKNCGDDGCGGVCGVCSEGFTCNGVQQCEVIPVSNPTCETAQMLTVTTTETSIIANNVAATTPTTDCFNAPNPLWYVITTADFNEYTFRTNTPETTFDTRIGVVAETCGGTCVASNDDISTGIFSSLVTFCGVPEQTFYILVSGFSSPDNGVFELVYSSENTGTCCTPNCDDKDCGDDGCGGSCGTCFENEICDMNGECAAASSNNDACLTSFTVDGMTSIADQNNLAATIDVLGCNDQLSLGVWYRFSGTGDMVSFSTCSNTFDTVIHVFEGLCATLSCVVTNDDGCSSGFGSTASVSTQIGSNYYIVVDGYNGRIGNFDLDITTTGGPSSLQIPDSKQVEYSAELDYKYPTETRNYGASSFGVREILSVNEDCGSAIDLDGMGFPGTVIGITDTTKNVVTPVTFGCIASSAPGLWYSFTGTGDMVRINTCATTTDSYSSIIQVMSGTCDDFVCEGYGTPSTSPLCNSGSDVVICTTMGTTYWIIVEGEGGQTGEFSLSVANTGLPCRAPTNTACTSATVLTNGVPVPVVHKDYTPSVVDDCSLINSPDGFALLSNVAWFSFSSPNSNKYLIDLCSNGFIGSFSIQVYEGTSCDTARCFGSNQISATSCTGQNNVEFCATTGTNYYIAVYGDYGRYTITLQDLSVGCDITCNPICPTVAECGDDTCGGDCGICTGGATCEDFICVSEPSFSTTTTLTPTTTTTLTSTTTVSITPTTTVSVTPTTTVSVTPTSTLSSSTTTTTTATPTTTLSAGASPSTTPSRASGTATTTLTSTPSGTTTHSAPQTPSGTPTGTLSIGASPSSTPTTTRSGAASSSGTPTTTRAGASSSSTTPTTVTSVGSSSTRVTASRTPSHSTTTTRSAPVPSATRTPTRTPSTTRAVPSATRTPVEDESTLSSIVSSFTSQGSFGFSNYFSSAIFTAESTSSAATLSVTIACIFSILFIVV